MESISNPKLVPRKLVELACNISIFCPREAKKAMKPTIITTAVEANIDEAMIQFRSVWTARK